MTRIDPHLEKPNRVAAPLLDLGARLAEANRRRKLRTPERALAEIDKLDTEGREELGAIVYVWPAPRGRVTGHFVGCDEHGGMPFLAPSKAAAHLAAARHVKYEHGSKGTVVLRDRPVKLKAASR